MAKTRLLARALVAGAVILGACSDTGTGPTSPVAAPSYDLSATQLQMVRWNTPRATSASVTRTVDPLLGGTLSAGGVTLIVPPLAVSRRTQVTLTVPAGQYVMAELEPHGLTFRVDPLLLFPVIGTDAGLLGITNLIGVYSKSDPVNGLITPDETYSLDLIGTLLGFKIHHFSTYAPARKGLILMGG